MTKTAALLGFPLAHSITPSIYGPTFKAMGVDALSEAWVTPSESLAENVARLRGADYYGANVTVPHKEAVIPMLDSVDSGAERIGAVNCIHNRDGHLHGYNTDLYGFMRALDEAGFVARGADALLLGAGGAARAVAVGLLDAGVRSLIVTGRDISRVKPVAADFERMASGATIAAMGWDEPAFADACRSAALVVNCTPVGTIHTPTEGTSPIPASLLRPGVVVYDLVYNPPDTRLILDARAAGARTIGGLDMLLYQGARSLELWLGVEPPIDVMRSAARAALGLT